MRLGLVLGGGGPVGTAWYSGVFAGLAEGGIDLSGAEVVVGTSAGAVAGVWIASGSEISDFMRAVTASARRRGSVDLSGELDLDLLAEIYTTLGEAKAPLEPAEARRLCALAHAAPADDADSIGLFSQQLPDVEWPGALEIAVVEATSGELWLIEEADGVPLPVAVAASASAPGIRPPTRVHDKPCVDGGARSSTNADVLVRSGVDKVLVLNPVAADTPLVGRGVDRTLEEERRRLEEAGKRTRVVVSDDIERRAFGVNLLDLSLVGPAIKAGVERGRADADELAAWLDG